MEYVLQYHGRYDYDYDCDYYTPNAHTKYNLVKYRNCYTALSPMPPALAANNGTKIKYMESENIASNAVHVVFGIDCSADIGHAVSSIKGFLRHYSFNDRLLISLVVFGVEVFVALNGCEMGDVEKLCNAVDKTETCSDCDLEQGVVGALSLFKVSMSTLHFVVVIFISVSYISERNFSYENRRIQIIHHQF
jgi:hypothetical protein